MKRVLLGVCAAAGLALAATGCKTVDEKRADYHEWRAERASDSGNYGAAHEQDVKASKARSKVKTDPLP